MKVVNWKRFTAFILVIAALFVGLLKISGMWVRDIPTEHIYTYQEWMDEINDY